VTDIRWQQRLSNFDKAVTQLSSAVKIFHDRKLSELETQGLIQAYEYTYELAWNVMRDYFRFLGIQTINGPRDAFRESFQKGLIHEGENWMAMIESRNQTSYTYNQILANQVAQKIIDIYFPMFCKFRDKMDDLAKA